MGGQRSSSQSWFSNFSSSALRVKTLNGLPPSGSSSSSNEGLIRRLGLFDLILLGIGASIGAGIFVCVTISFIFAGGACVLNALCYAELASRLPAVVGGAYLYTYVAFNELTAFLVFTQLMLDYHVRAASIARSLAGYLVSVLELFPFFKEVIPSWIGSGGLEFFGGVVSINLLAPILLVFVNNYSVPRCWRILCCELFYDCYQVVIVLIVIFAGAFEVDVSNWTLFAPNGFKAIVTGINSCIFLHIGSANWNYLEAFLYVQFCISASVVIAEWFLHLLGEDAPLASLYVKGLKFVSILISIGAVAGLTTTLLVGLYVQSRLYLGLGRDGLLPSIFCKVHPTRHTPIHFSDLVVSACVVTLRWKEKASSQFSTKWISSRQEGIIFLAVVAFSGFTAGLCYRFNASFVFMIVAAVVAVLAAGALHFRQVYRTIRIFLSRSSILPATSIFVNIFLFAQVLLLNFHMVRFVVLSIIAVLVYAFYGQFHADPTSNQTIVYHRAATEES
ncbi:hypothetical protein MKW92_022798 [Papaver armeniacum]|nr:hypothetical protein MKW92_022798 [Papaver armeniacum]